MVNREPIFRPLRKKPIKPFSPNLPPIHRVHSILTNSGKNNEEQNPNKKIKIIKISKSVRFSKFQHVQNSAEFTNSGNQIPMHQMTPNLTHRNPNPEDSQPKKQILKKTKNGPPNPKFRKLRT
jgi:hypothetical protein